MKKDYSKRNILIGAILSRDKERLKEALQQSKPEKWVTYQTKDNSKILEYLGKKYTWEELKQIIKDLEKEFNVRQIHIDTRNHEDRTREESFNMNPDILTIYKTRGKRENRFNNIS